MKLAAAVLALLLPLLAQPELAKAQERLEPPYLLAPGENPPPPPSPSGSYPALTTNWGHKHPECPSAASIESTTCSQSGTIPAGTTLQNCTLNGGVTFGGSNITLSCVKWDVPSDSASRAASCSGTCQNVRILRTTMTGNEPGSGGVGMTFLNLSSSYGSSGPHTMLVEKSVIGGNRVGVILGGGKFDRDRAVIEGAIGSGYAFVMRQSILRNPQYVSGDHSELVALVESTNGALFQNNLFYCQDGDTCNTGNMLAQPANGGTIKNISLIGNRIVSDSTGYAMTFDQDKSRSGNCVTGVRFENNVVESHGSGVWLYGTCPSIQSRTGSTCTGNTVNGSPSGC